MVSNSDVIRHALFTVSTSYDRCSCGIRRFNYQLFIPSQQVLVVRRGLHCEFQS